jgi:hypothetical protein
VVGEIRTIVRFKVGKISAYRVRKVINNTTQAHNVYLSFADVTLKTLISIATAVKNSTDFIIVSSSTEQSTTDILFNTWLFI